MYIEEIEARVAGIPCLIGVTHYHSVRGSYSRNAASDLDYHGYTEVEWEVLDRRGRRALWLERKMSDFERDEIDDLVNEKMKDDS